MYYDKHAEHYKLTVSGISEYYEKVADFKMNIQPSTGESTAMVNGIYGRTFTAFTGYMLLNIEDQIKVNTKVYRVKAVQLYDYDPLRFCEAILSLPE